jgi:hypothetical protein
MPVELLTLPPYLWRAILLRHCSPNGSDRN